MLPESEAGGVSPRPVSPGLRAIPKIYLLDGCIRKVESFMGMRHMWYRLTG